MKTTEITKDVLKSILKKASSCQLTEKEKKAIEELNKMADDSDWYMLNLINTNRYKSIVYWKGVEDIESLLKKDKAFQELSPEEQETFVDNVYGRVYWDMVEDFSIEAGNEELLARIEEEWLNR